MDIKNRKWVVVSAAAMLVFVVVFLNTYELQGYERISGSAPNNSDCFGINGTSNNVNRQMRPPIPFSFGLLLSPALAMVATVLITYYLISRRLEEKLEKKMNLISKLLHKDNSIPKTSHEKADNAFVLRLFTACERKILETLIQKNGIAFQSEISRMEGMTVLRTHRTLKDLERKGIITLEGYGKTNRIILSGDARDVLMEK